MPIGKNANKSRGTSGTSSRSGRFRPSDLTGWFLVASFAILGLGAAVAYAVDKNQNKTLAKGLRVAGISVGGLNVDQAKKKLDNEIEGKALQPVIVVYGNRTFTLGPQRARMRVNSDSAIQEALHRSRDGGIVGRTLRRLSGQKVKADLGLEVLYSNLEVSRWVERIEQKLHVDPVDARLKFTDGELRSVEHKTGVKLNTKKLIKDVKQRIGTFRGDREIKTRVRVLNPSITTAELASANPTVLTVNRGAYEVTLWRKLKKAKTYQIAIGRAGQESPGGKFKILNKAVNPAWYVPDEPWAGDLAGEVIPPNDPKNPIIARWMGVTYDGVGFHGTNDEASIGTSASAGCFRMRIPEIKELYKKINVNTPVYID